MRFEEKVLILRDHESTSNVSLEQRPATSLQFISSPTRTHGTVASIFPSTSTRLGAGVSILSRSRCDSRFHVIQNENRSCIISNSSVVSTASVMLKSSSGFARTRASLNIFSSSLHDLFFLVKTGRYLSSSACGNHLPTVSYIEAKGSF